MIKICPVCAESISSWSMATGKVVQINGILYHIRCIGETKVKAISEGKWEPLKDEKEL